MKRYHSISLWINRYNDYVKQKEALDMRLALQQFKTSCGSLRYTIVCLHMTCVKSQYVLTSVFIGSMLFFPFLFLLLDSAMS